MVVEDTGVPVQSPISEVATFLAATAMVLRETVIQFEKTAARITEGVLARPDQADRDLIVTLQDFDRLQQEFATLAEVLTNAAAKPGDSWLRAEGGAHPAEDTIATISIADLKDRLMHRLRVSIMDLAVAPTGNEVVF
jgi:hypothetical protein